MGFTVGTVRQRFPRSSRLRSSENFKRVFKQGSKLKQGCLTTYASWNDIGCVRLGLAITKRVVLHATDRNRIRRVIRESFRLNKDSLGNLDIVVTVTHKSPFSKQVLAYDLNRQWLRLAVYYKKA